jgi:hypothetical protein
VHNEQPTADTSLESLQAVIPLVFESVFESVERWFAVSLGSDVTAVAFAVEVSVSQRCIPCRACLAVPRATSNS